uniref:Uncharacterized protein n=1 Tax=Cynoglossus semilaevis TaxID=244447 RepID=A0A3P8W6A2_CYNSE
MLVEGRWRDLKQQRRQPLFLTLSYKIVPCCHKIHLYVCLTSTSGGFLKDRLTPAVRFSPWATPLLGPMAPMVSSDCRVLTGIPETQDREKVLGFITAVCCSLTGGHQSELVLFISDLLLLHVSAWEEKSHHPFEELVHELDGQWHNVHLHKKEKKLTSVFI